MLFPARKNVSLILSLLFVWLTLPGAAGAQSDQKAPNRSTEQQATRYLVVRPN
ncbi:hypothetical protein [Brevibacillus parabrevis]|uniref:hypothetical protein n=1 Tax=Brevibacillus parabrevis TaxID=54914 RepID=UPI000A7E8871|nr:hypothetical protein [Brevibacillus parabrevis]